MRRLEWILCAMSLCCASVAPAAPASEPSPVDVVRGIVQRVGEQLAAAESSHASVHAPASPSHKAVAKHSLPATPRPAASHAAPHAAEAPGTAAATPPDAEAVWERLLAGNRRFAEYKSSARSDAARRAELAKAQHPVAIVLACADSRLSPELVFDQGLGELFVVRTAGNVADAVALGSIEYAVEHLHVPLIVVMGHEKCGAVRAALEPGDMPTANLQAIVDRIRPATQKPRTCFEGEELVSRSVAANVHQSARDLEVHSPVVAEHLRGRTLVLRRAVYDLASGAIHSLD